MASRDAAAAAIASRTAAAVYGLKIIASSIEDEPQNTTRFVVIAAHDAGPSGKDKTSLVMSTRNEPGAMRALLTPLAGHGVSMTRLESRPARTGRWEYLFYVDIEGHQHDPNVAQALKELGEKAAFSQNLGSYLRGAQLNDARYRYLRSRSRLHPRDLRRTSRASRFRKLARELGLDPDGIIKLASNENPLGVSPLAMRAARQALEDAARYPDGNGFELKQALARTTASRCRRSFSATARTTCSILPHARS